MIVLYTMLVYNTNLASRVAMQEPLEHLAARYSGPGIPLRHIPATLLRVALRHLARVAYPSRPGRNMVLAILHSALAGRPRCIDTSMLDFVSRVDVMYNTGICMLRIFCYSVDIPHFTIAGVSVTAILVWRKSAPTRLSVAAIISYCTR